MLDGNVNGSLRRLRRWVWGMIGVTLWIAVAGFAAESGLSTATERLSLQSLAQSLEKTTAAETAEIAKLQEQLEQARALARTADSELTLHAIQISTHSNLLLLPDTPAAELTKARAASQALAGGLTERLKELAHNRSTVDQLRQQAEEQFRLNEKQLVEIGTAVAREIDAQALQRQLQRINRLLLEKRSLLAAIFETLDLTAGRIEETRKTLLDLVKKFDQALLRQKNDALFHRSASPLTRLSSAQILDETKQLVHHLRRLWPGAYWVARLEEIWQPGELRILSFILLGTIFLTLVFRTRRYFKHLETRPFYRRHVWCCLAAQMLQNSLPLLGVIVFLYAYARSQALYAAYPELRALVQLLVIWLFSRWWLDFLNIRFRETAPGGFPPEAITLLRRLILLACALGFFWVIIGGFLGNTAVILRLLRIVFGFGLAGGILRLLRICIPLWGERLQTDNRWWPALKSAFVALGYTLAGGGLLLDLMGFDQLAYHWYASLGRSAAVLLWGGVTIRVLQEWDSDINGAKAPDAGVGPKQAHPLRWFFIRVAWLATGAIILVSLLMAWDVKQGVIVGILRGLNYPIPFGGMQFRLIGLIYVALILLATLTVTRLWRRILRQKILADSGLEIGLQESVTSISIYVLWTLGILWALRAFGVSTTSMAVAFGALGIGLGFGLQNIFNNFISGLILLLERPIQVGDTVEINGVWATVTRINVRSTVVQTFDNASLIIPNSEFISNQLTNWSFKDLRLRRKIIVGVAYGSDVERVRETLLEIARNNALVLDTPQPDVYFSDFADSALIFQLRIWSTLDDFLKAETQIRFAIDRLFRERNIQIPFPQRDVHVRSALEASPAERQSSEAARPAPPHPAATAAEDRT